eukprot:s2662_g2.t1
MEAAPLNVEALWKFFEGCFRVVKLRCGNFSVNRACDPSDLFLEQHQTGACNPFGSRTGSLLSHGGGLTYNNPSGNCANLSIPELLQLQLSSF